MSGGSLRPAGCRPSGLSLQSELSKLWASALWHAVSIALQPLRVKTCYSHSLSAYARDCFLFILHGKHYYATGELYHQLIY